MHDPRAIAPTSVGDDPHSREGDIWARNRSGFTASGRLERMGSGSFTLGTRAVARVAAALWVGCGALVAVVIPVVAPTPETHRGAVVAIGVLAVVFGTVVWFLPWDRWRPTSTLALVPVAFLVIALFNRAAYDPWSYN